MRWFWAAMAQSTKAVQLVQGWCRACLLHAAYNRPLAFGCSEGAPFTAHLQPPSWEVEESWAACAGDVCISLRMLGFYEPKNKM